MKKQENVKAACCSRRQKIWGVVALAGLFMCGLFVGAAWNGEHKASAQRLGGVYEIQCDAIRRQIILISTRENLSQNDIDELNRFNVVYEKNCENYETIREQYQQAEQNDTANKSTCVVIEDMLLRGLQSEYIDFVEPHQENIETYTDLIKYGCPENAEKYQALIQREQEIIEALKGQKTAESTTCAEIEKLLIQQLPTYNLNSSDVRIERAKIYANLSERGCPENSQQYVNLAAKELEIARALRDDKFDTAETVEVVETYKRLEMKQAASEVLDKVQKLTDPAIDFIIQVQKIIEE